LSRLLDSLASLESHSCLPLASSPVTWTRRA
jgi:hypothetical protein